MTKKEAEKAILKKLSEDWTPLDIRKILNKIEDEPVEVIDIDFIKEVTALLWGVSVESLTSKTRKRETVFARFMCFKYMRDFGHTWQRIGCEFNRDHASALYGVRSINNCLETKYIEVIERWQKFNEIISNKVEIN